MTVESAENLDLKGFAADQFDGIVLDNINTWGQLLRWRAVLQSRNAKSKGATSATNMYSYVQYLYGVPIVATVDFDAPDPELLQPGHPKASRRLFRKRSPVPGWPAKGVLTNKKKHRWLLRNLTILRLPAGETFFEQLATPAARIPNTFSMFAETVRKRRGIAA